MDQIIYSPVGIIHSPYKYKKGTPIQPEAVKEVCGEVELFPEFQECLTDLDGFSHIILIYHFHQSEGYDSLVIPYMDTLPHGVFSTRAPRRPNPVGMSVVRLLHIEGNRIGFQGVDMIDRTPLLDIKPYVPEFNANEEIKKGWLDKNVKKLPNMKDDGRFGK